MIKEEDLTCDNDLFYYKDKLFYYKDKLFTGQSIDNSGDKFCYKEGKLHRDNDLPAIEWNDGNKEWYKEGKWHREAGPALEYNDGDKEWFYNDEKIYCQDNEEFLKIIKLLLFK